MSRTTFYIIAFNIALAIIGLSVTCIVSGTTRVCTDQLCRTFRRDRAIKMLRRISYGKVVKWSPSCTNVVSATNETCRGRRNRKEGR